mgnify:CR=1 FL=1
MFTSSTKDFLFKLRYQFKGVPFHIGDQAIRLDESLRRWQVGSEWAFQEVLKKYLRSGDVFIDVGANFGLHTLYAAKLVGNQGRVFAFEPVPSNLKLLRKNIALSNVEQQVTIVPKAVSNADDQYLSFYIPQEDVPVTASLHGNSEQLQMIQVANVRLDDYWRDINLPVHLIKIDVEGAEMEVLRGSEKLLKQWQPNLLIEVHGFALPNFGSSVDTLRDFLNNLGYKENLLPGEQFHGEDYFQAIYLR